MTLKMVIFLCCSYKAKKNCTDFRLSVILYCVANLKTMLHETERSDQALN